MVMEGVEGGPGKTPWDKMLIQAKLKVRIRDRIEGQSK